VLGEVAFVEVMVVEERAVPSETVLDVPETEYHSLDHTEFMKTRPAYLLILQVGIGNNSIGLGVLSRCLACSEV